MSYTRTDPPVNTNASPLEAIQLLRKWIDLELRKLENELKTPELRGLQFETLRAIPARYKDGDLYYFGANVLPNPNQASGLYLRDSGDPSGWRKL